MKRLMYQSVVVNKELSQKVKLLAYWSIYVPSIMVMSFGQWPKERDRVYNRPKWVSSTGWTGWKARSPGSSSEWSRCFAASREVSRGCLGFRMPPTRLSALGGLPGIFPLGEGPREDPGHTGAAGLGTPCLAGRADRGDWCKGNVRSFLDCYPCNLTPDKR